MIIGRSADLETIRGCLERSRNGRATTLVVRGEPGIGKSTLLRSAIDMATAETRVLRVTGVEVESQIPFGDLFALVRPILAEIDGLPPRLADTLRGALGLAPPTRVDVFAIEMAVLSLLATASAGGTPLLIVVDDLQWLDPNSAAAILFGARRLQDDPVAVLIGVRSGSPMGEHVSDLPMLELGGLDVPSADELLTAAGTSVAHPVAEDLVRRTNGNPLALLEAGAVLDPLQRSGLRALGDAPIVGAGTERAFGRAMSDITPAAAVALRVLAVEPSDEREAIVAAAALLGAGAADFESAEGAGLIEQDARSIRFRHPLVREAVRLGSSAVQTRQAHAALAEVIDGRDRDARRAAHLGASTLEPDREVAAILEVAAREASARGDLVAAARGFARAATLTPEREVRAARLYAAGAAGTSSGLPEAAEWLRAAAADSTDPAVHEQVLVMQAFRATTNSENVTMLELADRYEQDHPSTPTSILLHAFATPAAWQRLDGRAIRRHADLIEASVGGPAGRAELHGLPGVAVVLGSMVAGQTDIELIRRIGEEMLADPSIDMAQPVLVTLAIAQQFDLQRRLLDVTLTLARRASALPAVAYMQSAAALLAAGSGRPADGVAPAQEAIELARLTGGLLAESQAHASMALCAADMGDARRCREHAHEASTFHERCDTWTAPLYAEHALGRLELGLGRPTDAVEHLLAVQDRVEAGGFWGPSLFPVLPDLLEALVRAGRDADARTWCDHTARRVADDPVPGLRHGLARARAALADADQIDEAFAAALADRELHGSLVERARTELLYGIRLRRAARRADARGPLEAALGHFAAAGASGWAEQVRRELTAIGAAPRPAMLDPLRALTPQEQQIAAIAATGVPTREIASSLFLSPKTIEAHLTRIYRKVGVRSKSELAHRLATVPGDPA